MSPARTTYDVRPFVTDVERWDPATRPLRDVREVIRDEMAMHAPILAAVGGDALSIPEIAAAIGKPPSEVVYWVMGMRRYGHLVEDPEADDDGYFHYRAGVHVAAEPVPHDSCETEE